MAADGCWLVMLFAFQGQAAQPVHFELLRQLNDMRRERFQHGTRHPAERRPHCGHRLHLYQHVHCRHQRLAAHHRSEHSCTVSVARHIAMH